MGIVTAVVVAAAVVGAAYMQKEGARKAANARMDAIKKMDSIDVPGLQAMARKGDEEQYQGVLDLQKKVDPNLSTLRENSTDQLAKYSGPQPTDALVDNVSNKLYDENIDDPQSIALKQKLLADAQDQIDAGATLPADFQAELVRTGLETTGRAGVSNNGAGAAGRNTRLVLGVAGQQLKQQRVQSALAESQGAQSLATTRASILAGLVPVLNNIPGARLARAAAGFDIAQGALPKYGFSGKEVVGLELARLQDENRKKAALGDLKAQKALADYSFYSSAIGAVGGAVSGYAGSGATAANGYAGAAQGVGAGAAKGAAGSGGSSNQNGGNLSSYWGLMQTGGGY